MNIYLLFLMQLFPFNNDTCQITMTFDISAFDSNYIAIRSPYNSEFFPEYQSGNDVTYTGKEHMEVRTPFKTASFYRIGVNNETWFPLALTCNDSVNISVKRTFQSSYTDYKILVSGSNEKAHNIYMERFFPMGKCFDFFDKQAKVSPDYTDYYLRSKQYIDSLTSVWDSLKTIGLVSKEIYDLYLADTRGALYAEAIKKLAKVKKPDSSYLVYTKWLNTRQVMYHHADAANPILLKTFIGIQLYHMYLGIMLDLDDAVKDEELKKSSTGYFYYYDTSYREWAWGSFLLCLKKELPVLENLDKGDVGVFRKYYPKSKFVTLIQQFQDSMFSSRKGSNTFNKTDTTQYDNLQGIFSKVHGHYAFIDVWATWCIPCLNEFNHLPPLNKFLDENGIKQVFLSVDDLSRKGQWLEFVKENGLPGYHFIISQKVQAELLGIMTGGKGGNLSVPRYLLLDKITNKVYPDLPRPSTGIILEQAIRKIITKD